MQPPQFPLVRRVRADDWRLLRAQRLEMVADTPVAYGETLDEARAHPDEHWIGRASSQASGGDRLRLLAFAESGELIGTAGGYAEDGVTWVVGVYIAPGHRGAGLLGELVDRVAAWSTENGRARLVLEVARENPRAVAAYRKLGFTETGVVRPHELYPGITEVEMARDASTG